MNSIWLIGANTFRQTVREKIFYNVVLFGIGMVVLSMVVGNLTFGHPDRVVRSIGLSGISLAVDIMALLVGVGLIHGEIDRKSLFVVLARPVRRWQYVAGRFLGLVGALVLITVGLTAVFAVVLVLVRGSLTARDVLAIVPCFFEACLLAGVGLVLSAFTTPSLGAGMGAGIWIVAATSDDLVTLSKDMPGLHSAAKGIAYLFPSFARLNFREIAVYGAPIPLGDVVLACGYAALYAGVLVALASLILGRREML